MMERRKSKLRLTCCRRKLSSQRQLLAVRVNPRLRNQRNQRPKKAETGPQPAGKGKAKASKEETAKAQKAEKVAKEKKPKAVTTKEKAGTSLPNGHVTPPVSGGSTPMSPSKMATAAKNALLKKQAQQAARISIPSLQGSPRPQRPQLVMTSPTAAMIRSPLVKASPTPKSPDPPPWSNPNLVIRTRKAAVHSPVILARPPAAMIQQVQRPPAPATIQVQVQPRQQTVQGATLLQQSLARPPMANTTTINLGGSPADRNIFQLFTSSSPGVGPTLRQVSPVNSGTLRGTTLINSTSLVNPAQLSGARIITPAQPSVVVSPQKAGGSGITLVPTVINAAPASGAQPQAILTPASILNTSAARATLLNSNRLASPITLTGASNRLASQITLTPTGNAPNRLPQPITLSGANTTNRLPQPITLTGNANTSNRLPQPITLAGLGGLPVLNLIKTSGAGALTTVPTVRAQQLVQGHQLARVPGHPGGFVLITPRATGGPATIVQGPAAGPRGGPRLMLAQVPTGATIVRPPQAPQAQRLTTATVININGGQPLPPKPKDS